MVNYGQQKNEVRLLSLASRVRCNMQAILNSSIGTTEMATGIPHGPVTSHLVRITQATQVAIPYKFCSLTISASSSSFEIPYFCLKFPALRMGLVGCQQRGNIMHRCLLTSIVMLCTLAVGCQSAAFNDFFYPSWAADHVMSQGQLLKLKLDNTSGAGFASKSSYIFGKVNVQIKLIPGDSAGTVTAFYMSSQGDEHDEFDFEFLGNTSGQPYTVQTNVYSKGSGNREQRMFLWFDPTADFHSYSFLWNRQQVVFFVDDVPTRVFRNNEKVGVPYPQSQPMGVYSSIWNADDWATQGGRVKTDWSHAPFVSTYKNFSIDACEASSNTSCSSWWDAPAYASLDAKQRRKLKWVQEEYITYDYCKDSARFPTPPPECSA